MNRVFSVLSRLPSEIVVSDRDIVSGYTVDFRRLYQGDAQAVLRPRSVAEVQQVVRVCSDHGVPLVPQGGNTSYCAAATPDMNGGELVLSLEKLNKIREVNQANLSLTSDAGAILSDIQTVADGAGLLLPLRLGSQQSCQIGGNIATNAGGTSVVRFGTARDMVLGLEVVLPDGTLLADLSQLRKNNAGYNVKQLFIGAEGTLGIITGVSLKLARKPRQIVTAFLAVRSLSDLTSLFEKAQAYSGEAISSFEYISGTSLSLLLSSQPSFRHPLGTTSEHYVLLEVATTSHLLLIEDVMTVFLAELCDSGAVLDGVLATNERQRKMLWQLREQIPEAEVHHGASVKHDIVVNTSDIALFIEKASARVTSIVPDALLSIYGHVGDGNVHFNVVTPKQSGKSYKKFVDNEISPGIYDLADEMGGSFSAEYGVGRVKIDLLRKYADPGKLAIMQKLKSALDPTNLINPGKVMPSLEV